MNIKQSSDPDNDSNDNRSQALEHSSSMRENSHSAMATLPSLTAPNLPATNLQLHSSRAIFSAFEQERNAQTTLAAQLSALQQERHAQTILATQLNRAETTNNALFAALVRSQQDQNNRELIARLSPSWTTPFQQQLHGMSPVQSIGHGATRSVSDILNPPNRGVSAAELCERLAILSNNAPAASTFLQNVQCQNSIEHTSDTVLSKKKKTRKGRPTSFPNSLFQMLMDLEEQAGGTSVASFLPHGRSFIIHKPTELVNDIIPKYFNMTSFDSFRRQLRMYGFKQISVGPEKGAYFHDLFSREDPESISKMKRVMNK